MVLGRVVVVLLPLLVGGGLVLLLPDPPVRGRVVDEQGRPLASALVRWQTTATCTRTDAAGRFALPAALPGSHLTAAREGRYIAGTTVNFPGLPVELVLRPPPTDHPDYVWVDPGPERDTAGNCASCHAELYREWQGSAHARSATGAHFRDLYAGTDRAGRPGVSWGLLTQNDLGAGVCVSCHAPALADDDPAVLDLRRLDPATTAARGVHCDYCHKVEALAGPIDGLNHGRFNLRLRRPPPGEQAFFGPLDDASGDDDVYSPFQRDSRFCAACHEGIVFGVPVYTTYSEWQASPAGRQGRSCQSCHLRPTGRLTNVAPGRGGTDRDPHTLANHTFFVGDLPAMLRSCLRLALTATHGPDGVGVRVEVLATGVGHRVPTGYIDRHLILTVTATDAAGRPVEPVAGPRLPPPVGSLAGRAGRLFGRVLTDPEGGRPAPFWHARHEVDDSRLEPEVPQRFAWTFPTTATAVRARLVYRRFWETVAMAKGWGSVETSVVEATATPRE